MQLSNLGSPVPVSDLLDFEQQLGVKVPEPVAWFLTTVANGGRPALGLELPVDQRSGEPFVLLHGLYGINRREDFYDLEIQLKSLSAEVLGQVFPLGYDDGNGPIFYAKLGPLHGSVVWIPWDEYCEQGVRDQYLVVGDMQAFAKLIADSVP
jgi:hypothetical protein